ncbi:glycosyltransferase family 2 protein [Kineosporia sp. R_H_3]|uniref:glycosyltransferase family 2 protein n=1 Tax=Kineosporia sp. R_H_3 TaxID=1961848 RepID=UPI001E5369FC|nr:glycosyltransferase family A protein [Kineosporia sp. R_H_3]
MTRLWRRLVWAGSLGSAALTAHSLVNMRALRVPDDDPPPVDERVSVLLPVRDEAAHVGRCLASVLEQVGVEDLEVLVLDDGSTDGTADVVRQVAGDDPRVRLLTGTPPPAGWLGKPNACARLAEAASGSVLVFLDADVRLAPHAVAATVDLLRRTGLDLVSPYPRQLARTPAERLVQPLLQWSWLTTLPLRLAESSPRPSLAAANGQLLAVDAATYAKAGGHGAVRGEVLDDIALLRAVKAVGGTGGVVDGSHLATCRMYDGWAAVRDGYSKSLWSAFGSRAGAAATLGGLGVLYVVPAVAALRGSRVGLAGYVAAVAGRYAVAERTGGRSLPDSFAHPASVAVLGWLTARSWRLHDAGALTWKGRVLPGGDG